MSFLLDSDQLYKDKDGEWVQSIWELTYYPVCTVKPPDMERYKNLLLQIYEEAHDQAVAEQFKQTEEQKMNGLITIVTIFCVTMLIIASIIWFRS